VNVLPAAEHIGTRIAANGPEAAFDCNANGRSHVADVVRLFNYLRPVAGRQSPSISGPMSSQRQYKLSSSMAFSLARTVHFLLDTGTDYRSLSRRAFVGSPMRRLPADRHPGTAG